MKSLLKILKLFLILFEISSLVLVQTSEPLEFCSDSNELVKVFTIGNTTYLQKKDNFYTKKSDEVFAGKTSVTPKQLFNGDFTEIDTGFFIPVIPSCNKKNNKCLEMEKLEQVALVIGLTDQDTTKTYKMYKHINDTGALAPMKYNWNLPFQMKAQGQIEIGHLWPRIPDEQAVYLGSTYDEKTHALIHMIKEGYDLVLFINYIRDPKVNWIPERNPWVYPNNVTIKTFNGFIKIQNTNGSQNTNAIAYLDLNPSLKSETLLNFDSYHNSNHVTQKYFNEQSTVNLRKDIYGCPNSSIPSNPSSSSSSTTEWPDFTETTKQVSSYTTESSTHSNTRVTDQLTTEPDTTTQWDGSNALETDSTSKNETTILTWALVVVFLMSIVLFIIMLSTLFYIRHYNLRRRQKKKRLIRKQKKKNKKKNIK